MKIQRFPKMFVLLSLFLCSAVAFSEQSLSVPTKTPSPELSIWNRNWYSDQGIQLPRQVGVGVNYISMSRQIEISDISVTFNLTKSYTIEWCDLAEQVMRHQKIPVP